MAMAQTIQMVAMTIACLVPAAIILTNLMTILVTKTLLRRNKIHLLEVDSLIKMTMMMRAAEDLPMATKTN